MFRRIFLFVLTNIAIIVAASIIFFIVESVFGVRISGYFNGDYIGLAVFAIIYGFIGSFVSLAISRWMAKRAYRIDLICESDLHTRSTKEQLVYSTVSQIASTHGIKMPEVGLYQAKDPNAFATGPSKNKSLVAVSSALLEQMNDSEIQGVVGHEMAHILNGDMVTMTLLQGVINAFVIFFARIVAQIITSAMRDEDGAVSAWAYYGIVILLEIVFGFLGMIVLMKFSRWREFRADAGSAKYVGRDKMIAGLQKLQNLTEQNKMFSDKKMGAAKIADQSSFLGLFRSHPPIAQRIDRLTHTFA